MAGAGPATADPDERRPLPARDFVPVEAVARRTDPIPAIADATFLAADQADAWETRTSLFGDADR
jgi:hypothetical protein